MKITKVIKRDGSEVAFDGTRIKTSLKRCFKTCKIRYTNAIYDEICSELGEMYGDTDKVSVEDVQDIVEVVLMAKYPAAAKEYILFRKHKEEIRDWVDSKEDFIRRYKGSSNTANATVDDNSNVSSKNIGILNSEIHKSDNIQISRRMVVNKLGRLFQDFDGKQYLRDLETHILYKNDESSFAGAISPYCVALSMYPFINSGIKGIGGLSAKPKNLDSFCGMFVNMIFAVASQFAGAVAVPEALMYFDYYARKEWGNDYYLRKDDIVNPISNRPRTIQEDIHQRFQQIIYSINQPAAARGMQSAFVNFSYFDKPFFDGMFGEFCFPDGSEPIWESVNWLQKDFMMWFNAERMKCVLTFPVESFAMVYQNGEFLDKDSAEFVAQEYARGHSFFTYISDTVDSLSSCCFDGKTRVMYSGVDSKNFEKCVEISEAYSNNIGKTVEVLSYNPYTGSRVWRRGEFVKSYTDNWIIINEDSSEIEWRHFKMTPDHILPIVRNDVYMDVQAKDIVVGDYILYDKAQHTLAFEDFARIEKVPVKTVRIEEVEHEECYCVKMEDVENQYFVLSNGLITHNCRLKNKLQTKEFNFTNGNIGVMTGSKSVISLNLSRITQDWFNKNYDSREGFAMDDEKYASLTEHLGSILDRVYKYHITYNELLWDMKEAHLLPVYDAGFIDLNKQYLTIGLNGLNQAAEFLGMTCNDNKDYMMFCENIFGYIQKKNKEAGKDKFNGHKLSFNTEQVPAESLAIKNYNWDKEDGYWVPDDTNLYASYIFKPNDNTTDIFEKIRMHGKDYIGDYLDGGSAAHINLEEHLSLEQYRNIIKYAAEVGCSYFTFNIPMTECRHCGHIVNAPVHECPVCGSDDIQYYTRIIGYLTAVPQWSDGRQKEFGTRVFHHVED